MGAYSAKHDRTNRVAHQFHDLRHTAIRNRAAAGLSPLVLMYEASHSNMAITQRYIDLAGLVFAEGAAQAEPRMRRGFY